MTKNELIRELEKELYYFNLYNSMYQKTIDRNDINYDFIIPFNEEELMKKFHRLRGRHDYEKIMNIFICNDEYNSTKKTKYKNIRKQDIKNAIKDIKYFVSLMQKEIRKI